MGLAENRLRIVAYGYELIPGDLVVDEWENISREVVRTKVSDRETVVTFTDGEPETYTRRPGQQMILDVHRLPENIPEPSGMSDSDDLEPVR
jgi:hypothetical protein